MKFLRFALFAVAVLGLSAWVWLRKPHSPTDDLVPIAYAAFQVNAPAPEAGLALAEAARGWEGVNAVTYNPDSDLLVAIFTPVTTAQAVQTRLQELTPQPVVPKVFVAPDGPKCPVPQETLAALPGIFLATGVGAALALLLLLAWTGRRRRLSVAA